MVNEFELEGLALGDFVRDTVDGIEGMVVGLVVHRYNVAEAKVEEQRPSGKVAWRPLGRLEKAAAKSIGLAPFTSKELDFNTVPTGQDSVP